MTAIRNPFFEAGSPVPVVLIHHQDIICHSTSSWP
jgi:hypothetical protein